MKSTERRLKLLLLLQSSPNKRLTARQLASRFEVSRRTIFRDLRFLEKIDVPITWDDQRGYHIIRGYKIPPLMFTQKELATILVGLSFVKSQVDAPLAGDAQGVELKIQNVLPPELQHFKDTLQDRVVIAPYMNFGMEKTEGGSWYTISQAIARHRRLMFRYESRKDNILTLRKLDPYLLVFFQDHWNLIGYSHKRKSIRNFLLSRISNLQITDEDFELPEHFDRREIIFNRDQDQSQIEVAVENDTVTRFKSYLPAPVEREQTNDDGSTRIVFRFDNLDYLNQWLLQFSDSVSVLKPEPLKKRRRRLLKRMLEKQ